MPTMRQTGINPQTEQKLSGTKRPNNNYSSEVFIPIRTPSALLARDPHHLSSSLEVSLDSIQNLRSTVAECVVLDPYVGHGGRAEEIREAVTKFCVAKNDDHHSSGEGDEEGHRPPPITIGAVTALDLYAQTLVMKRIYSYAAKNQVTQHHNALEYISTGSVALDQLLLPNNSYQSFDEGYWNNLSFPYQIPNFDSCTHDAITPTTPHSGTTSSSSSSNGGIPFGQITEISGKPSSGKTQLAIAITAHALVVNNLQVKYLIAGGGGGSSRMAISRRLFAVCVAVAKSHLLLNNMTRQKQQQQQQQQGHNNDDSTIHIDKEAKSIALKCLERVTIATAHDAYSLLGSLVQIENEELSYRSTFNADVSLSASLQTCMENHHQGTLVVIDSISGCLGHHIYSDLILGASLSNQVSLTLRRMTRSFDGHFDSSSSSSVVMDNHHLVDKMWQQHPPRRFAVVVINGTVGKGANDNTSGSSSEVGGSGGMKSSYTSSHKPAMGRYWQGGDMGLWLEEEDGNVPDAAGGGDSNSHAISSLFYDGNVPGLSRSSDKVVTATLQWHYGKSLWGVDGSSKKGEHSDGRQARFVIQAGGVVDV